MGDFIKKLKRVKIRDLLQLWKLPISIIIAMFYKRGHKDLWIVCEDANEARDNGYWFFKYVRQTYPEQEIIYAIHSKSVDYEKVKTLGDTVEYGSLRHWIYYLTASKKISSQKAGNPNAAIFYFLEVYGLLIDKRVFLQHGVIKDDLKWLYYDTTKMDKFICGAYPEYKFVKETFGYPPNHVVYTGLCRFDGLHDCSVDKNLILIMPTWREWIADEDYRLLEYEGSTDISKANYFVQWSSFISDKRLESLGEEYKVKFVFFPHRGMQKYLSFFPKSTKYLEIAGADKYTVQELLKNSALMITDYSSVFFDYIYMKKPVIYYQFDYQQFRKGQYGEGYYNYKDNPFGASFERKEDVFVELENYIINGFSISKDYELAHKEYFRLYDTDNCKRVYEVIKRT